MKTKDRPCSNLLSRYVLGIAIIPNIVFAISIYGCRSEHFAPFAMFMVVLFIPMTLYYIPPSFVSGGCGFVGQMGVGPENLIGFLIAVVFWSIVAFLASKSHSIIKQKKQTANKSSEPT